MAESEFEKNVKRKRELQREAAKADLLAALKRGDNVTLAYFDFELRAYRLDGHEGLFTLVNAPHASTVRAYSMSGRNWGHFIPVGPARLNSIIDRIVDEAVTPP